MKTRGKNHVTITILSVLMFVLFLVHSAIAEKVRPNSVPEKAVVETVADGQATSNIDGSDNKKETNETRSVGNSCEYEDDDNSSLKFAQLLPYEIFNGDYAGMLAKLFDFGTC